ncbi:MAG: hypothetical protein V4760_06880 [Bdellovibrionota bacterium]
MFERNDSFGGQKQERSQDEASFSDFLELHGKCALVVDDSPDNRLLMVRI